MNARETIFSNLRARLKEDGASRQATAALRLANPKANLIPAKGQQASVERFIEEAEKVDTITHRVKTMADVPGIVAGLGEGNVKVTPDLQDLDWPESVAVGIGSGDDYIGVSLAFAGVSETGTAVMVSGPEQSTTLNFLPDIHVIVLHIDKIQGNYEQVWAEVRKLGPSNGKLPRTVNWITGPSRTGDIEQILLLGAHGPRALHVILIGG